MVPPSPNDLVDAIQRAATERLRTAESDHPPWLPDDIVRASRRDALALYLEDCRRLLPVNAETDGGEARIVAERGAHFLSARWGLQADLTVMLHQPPAADPAQGRSEESQSAT